MNETSTTTVISITEIVVNERGEGETLSGRIAKNETPGIFGGALECRMGVVAVG